jgi:hypothetical protein
MKDRKKSETEKEKEDDDEEEEGKGEEEEEGEGEGKEKKELFTSSEESSEDTSDDETPDEQCATGEIVEKSKASRVSSTILRLQISILRQQFEDINASLQKKKNISKSDKETVANFAELLHFTDRNDGTDEIIDESASDLDKKAWSQLIHFYSVTVKETVADDHPLHPLIDKLVQYLYTADPIPVTERHERLQKHIDMTKRAVIHAAHKTDLNNAATPEQTTEPITEALHGTK